MVGSWRPDRWLVEPDIHRRIHGAGLGREKAKDPDREKEKHCHNRTPEVCLDRADNVIEGGRAVLRTGRCEIRRRAHNTTPDFARFRDEFQGWLVAI